MIIELNKDQVNLLIRESRKEYPKEACGVLFGSVCKEKAYVKKIALLKNLLDSENRFQMDPTEFLRALLNAEKKGLQHIGFFHSHPLNTKPSAIDLEYMKLWPEIIWLIISPLNCRMAAYQIIDGHLREVSVKVKISDKCLKRNEK
ncbi:M67 family metallopeptidase [Candidatus Bathyarchaeota archaeon]|nr:M67 family metallopeptidase [Candidatus Bathyarchaeota archaeon]